MTLLSSDFQYTSRLFGVMATLRSYNSPLSHLSCSSFLIFLTPPSLPPVLFLFSPHLCHFSYWNTDNFQASKTVVQVIFWKEITFILFAGDLIMLFTGFFSNLFYKKRVFGGTAFFCKSLEPQQIRENLGYTTKKKNKVRKTRTFD